MKTSILCLLITLIISIVSCSISATVSELSLTSITLRAYFVQGSSNVVLDYVADNELNAVAQEAFQYVSSSYATNTTKNGMKENKFHSVEEAIYETLFIKTTIEITSQSSCPISNWIVSTNCLMLTLSRTVHFYDNDYFMQEGQGIFTKLVDYYLSAAFTSEKSMEDFETALKSSQAFNSLSGLRSDIVLPEPVIFEDRFKPVLNPNLYYDTKTEHEFGTMAQRPASLFFYSSLAFLIGVIFVIWNEKRYEERKKLLNSHFNTASRAMLGKASPKEGEESVNTDLDDYSLGKLRDQGSLISSTATKMAVITNAFSC